LNESDPLSGLRAYLANLRESEDIFASTLDIRRNNQEFDRTSARLLAERIGWSDAAYDLVAAQGKALIAAETSFGAAVELRLATERLIAELEKRGDDG
jgi:hypothetical protein